MRIKPGVLVDGSHFTCLIAQSQVSSLDNAKQVYREEGDIKKLKELDRFNERVGEGFDWIDNFLHQSCLKPSYGVNA